jgi:hypothetical protein
MTATVYRAENIRQMIYIKCVLCSFLGSLLLCFSCADSLENIYFLLNEVVFLKGSHHVPHFADQIQFIYVCLYLCVFMCVCVRACVYVRTYMWRMPLTSAPDQPGYLNSRATQPYKP